MQNNQNPFNNPNSPFNKMNNMMPKRSHPAVRHIAALIFGFVPILVMSILLKDVNVGVRWGIGILTTILATIAVSLIAWVSKDLNRDAVPLTVAWSIMMVGYWGVPLLPSDSNSNWLWILYIVILPIFFFVGFIIGGIGTFILTMRKLNTDMKRFYDENPDVKKQNENMMKNMQNQQRMNNQSNKPNQLPKEEDKKDNNKDKKDNKDDWEDNPFVNIDKDNESKK